MQDGPIDSAPIPRRKDIISLRWVARFCPARALTSILAAITSLAWGDPSPSLLDERRIPKAPFSATVEIRHSAKSAAPPVVSVFRSRSHIAQDGTIATLLLCTQPAKDVGKRVLLRGDGCWFFDPRAKRPTRISAGQVWSQPTATDSPNWRLARDFTFAPAGRESISCADGRTRACAVMDFTPKDKSLPAPARMRYWADDEGRFWRVQHFTSSGKAAKTIDILRYAKVLGAEHVTGLRITSGPDTAEVTISDFAADSTPAEGFEPHRFYRTQP